MDCRADSPHVSLTPVRTARDVTFVLVIAAGAGSVLVPGCGLDERGLLPAGNDAIADVDLPDVGLDEAGDAAADTAADVSPDVAPDAPDGGFVPTDVTGLVLWLRADLGVTQQGGNVKKWADQSGQGFDLDVQDGTNTYAANCGPNSTPCIQFSLGPLYRKSPLVPGADAPRSIFLVVQTADTTDRMAVVLDGNVLSDGIGYFLNDGAAQTRGILVTSGGIEHDMTAPFTTAWEPVCVINTGVGSQELRVGQQPHTLDVSSYPVLSSTGSFSVGGAAGSSKYNFIGGVAEVIVYNHALLSAEQSQVDNYLSSRYGL